ncbi:MAG: hypothetical protein ABJC26_05025, partial [Gemmatimonadaceae bacterium]
MCPSWYQGPEKMPPWDERVGIDQAISLPRQSALRSARAKVITLLDSAVAESPNLNGLIGQQVRMLVDQQEFAQAERVVKSCKAEEWWCDALHGYVANGLGHRPLAEVQYAKSVSHMDVATRCAWTDVHELLDGEFRRSYAKLDCAARDTVNRMLWWLADPLWIESGNDRQAEHFERRTLLALRSALVRDERFDWRVEMGSDARAEMVMRFGWPSFMFWRGFIQDSLRSNFLHIQMDSQGNYSPPNVPFVSYEYGAGRTHLVPTSNVLWNPFTVSSSEWVLSAPAGGDSVIHFELPNMTFPKIQSDNERNARQNENGKVFYEWESEIYPNYAKNTLWWPNEHYAAPHKLVQLPEAQVALLRRQNELLFATATQFDSSTGRARGSSIDSVTLIITPHPDTILFPVRTRATVGQTFVMRTELPARPTMVGIEFPASTEQQPAGRTRFGITPPATLSAMQPNDRAISDPVLLRVPANNAATKNAATLDEFVLTTNADSALMLMAPNSTITKGSALGLYWETYGYSTTDSVSIAVRMQRTTSGEPHPTGFFRRLTSDANT